MAFSHWMPNRKCQKSRWQSKTKSADLINIEYMIFICKMTRCGTWYDRSHSYPLPICMYAQMSHTCLYFSDDSITAFSPILNSPFYWRYTVVMALVVAVDTPRLYTYRKSPSPVLVIVMQLLYVPNAVAATPNHIHHPAVTDSQFRTNAKHQMLVQSSTDRSSSISRLDSLSDKCRQSCSRLSISICSLRCSRTFSSRICRSSSANCAIFSLSAAPNTQRYWQTQF